jgi:hypothetical protein
MSAPASHSFRYEPDLCTLAEGETLTEWRRARNADASRSGRRRSLRRRLGAIRPASRSRSLR